MTVYEFVVLLLAKLHDGDRHWGCTCSRIELFSVKDAFGTAPELPFRKSLSTVNRNSHFSVCMQNAVLARFDNMGK